jgi:hypothetical protein
MKYNGIGVGIDESLVDALISYLRHNGKYLNFYLRVIAHGQPDQRIESVLTDEPVDDSFCKAISLFEFTDNGFSIMGDE